MYRTIIALLLVGCANGVSDPDPPTTSIPIATPQLPAPKESDTPEKPGPDCKLIRTVWGGNCRLDEYKCADGSYRLDGKCYPPDWTPPWENLPDPPPPYGDSNVRSRAGSVP